MVHGSWSNHPIFRHIPPGCPHHLKTEASAKEITGGLMAAAVRLGGHHVVDLLEVPLLVGLDDE